METVNWSEFAQESYDTHWSLIASQKTLKSVKNLLEHTDCALCAEVSRLGLSCVKCPLYDGTEEDCDYDTVNCCSNYEKFIDRLLDDDLDGALLYANKIAETLKTIAESGTVG